MKVAEVRAIYFDLSGQSDGYPSTKAGLLEEIERLISERSARELLLRRRADSEREVADRIAWRQDNDAIRASINSVFDTFPPYQHQPD